MRVLMDVACPACGNQQMDAWVERGGTMPRCACGAMTQRLWLSAPSITPQGTRPERRAGKSTLNKVDTKAIAAETRQEIEQKWARYSDPQIAEQAVSREINHKAGMADERGNPTPLPTPDPIVFEKPVPAAA